jgi:hypothetical protein
MDRLNLLHAFVSCHQQAERLATGCGEQEVDGRRRGFGRRCRVSRPVRSPKPEIGGPGQQGRNVERFGSIGSFGSGIGIEDRILHAQGDLAGRHGHDRQLRARTGRATQGARQVDLHNRSSIQVRESLDGAFREGKRCQRPGIGDICHRSIIDSDAGLAHNHF